MLVAMQGRLGEARGGWSSLIPGEYFYVLYAGARTWHERLAIWPGDDADWCIVTPDGDRYIERVNGSRPRTGPSAFSRVPPDSGRGADRAEVYLFRIKLTDDEIRNHIRQARRRASRTVVAPIEVLRSDGARQELEAFLEGAEPPTIPGPNAPPGGAPPVLPVAGGGDVDVMWEGAIGTEVAIPAGAVDIGGGYFGRVVDGRLSVYRRLPAATAAITIENHGKELRPSPGPGGADLRDRLRDSRTAPPDEEEDARTLWVEYDTQGQRYKPWKAGCDESAVHSYGSPPLEGPLTCLDFCRHAERHGGDARMWLDVWLRDKRVARTDRTFHELQTLVDALHLAGTWDQYNLGASLCCERLARRIQAICDAHRDPEHVSWSFARYYAGSSSATDAVMPSMRNYVARRAREDADIHAAHSRATTQQPGQAAASAAVDEGGVPPAGARPPKGRGRGKGRGLGPGDV